METFHIIVSIAATLVTTLVPSIIKIVMLAKDKRNAQTEAEAEKAKNAIRTEAQKLVASVEVDLAPIDKLLKNNNSGTAGSMKKRDAFRDLKVFCLENGHHVDDDTLNAVIEKEIEFSNIVNAKKNS